MRGNGTGAPQAPLSFEGLMEYGDVRTYILRCLDARTLTALAATSRFFQRHATAQLFRCAVGLPLPPRVSEAVLFQRVRWFYRLPLFGHDLVDFPFFRVRAAEQRLAQGVLRMLSCVKYAGGFYLVANVQPAMDWARGAHEVLFRIGKEIMYHWCRCRNG